MNVLCVLDNTGETRHPFDPSDADSVENARKIFNANKAKGFLSYKVRPGGDRGEIMNEFDPHVDGMIVVHNQLQGG